jgi:hypothetical protein
MDGCLCLKLGLLNSSMERAVAVFELPSAVPPEADELLPALA